MKQKSTILVLLVTFYSYPLLAQTPNPGNGNDVPPVIRDVNVVNTPGVTIENIYPLSVSVEGQTWEPFRFWKSASGGTPSQTINAPPDKRLIINSISSLISTNALTSNFRAAYIKVTTGLGSDIKATYLFPLTLVNVSGNTNAYVDTRDARILLEPGEYATFAPQSLGNASISAWQITASGYTTPFDSTLPPP